jgi:hypothetical protein
MLVWVLLASTEAITWDKFLDSAKKVVNTAQKVVQTVQHVATVVSKPAPVSAPAAAPVSAPAPAAAPVSAPAPAAAPVSAPVTAPVVSVQNIEGASVPPTQNSPSNSAQQPTQNRPSGTADSSVGRMVSSDGVDTSSKSNKSDENGESAGNVSSKPTTPNNNAMTATLIAVGCVALVAVALFVGRQYKTSEGDQIPEIKRGSVTAGSDEMKSYSAEHLAHSVVNVHTGLGDVQPRFHSLERSIPSLERQKAMLAANQKLPPVYKIQQRRNSGLVSPLAAHSPSSDAGTFIPEGYDDLFLDRNASVNSGKSSMSAGSAKINNNPFGNYQKRSSILDVFSLESGSVKSDR